MYIGVLEVSIEIEISTLFDKREFSSLIQKIKSRLKVSANWELSEEHTLKVYLAFLSNNKESIKNKSDDALEICELKGIGRILSDNLTIENLD